MTVKNDTRKEYFAESEKYSKLYQDYLRLKYSRNPSESGAQADAKFKELKDVDNKIKGLIDTMNQGGDSITPKLLNTNNEIERKTFQIYEKSKSLDIQQNEIEKRKEELHSRQKQIEMGVQKNRYRRNVIIFLIIINLVMLGAIYYFFNQT
jgi:hypothetical protein